MSTDLTNTLSNLAYSFAGLAAQSDREAEVMAANRERATSWGADAANLPDPATPRAAAAYFRFHEKTCREGFIYYNDPPAGCAYPQVAIPGYHDAVTEAVRQSRIRYGTASDAWRVTDFSTPRPPAAPAKEIPATRPWPGPTTGNRGTPSAPPPAGPRGTGEFTAQFSKKQVKALKKVAKERY